jgi:hypothetical protein
MDTAAWFDVLQSKTVSLEKGIYMSLGGVFVVAIDLNEFRNGR